MRHAVALPSILAIAAASLSARAADPARFALRGAEVHTVSGPIVPNGVVLVDGGKIAGVGSNLAIPAGYEIVDLAPGSVVVPGFVDAWSHVGADGETNETTAAISPEVRARDAFDPGDERIARVARGGITTVLVAPEDGNVVGGRAAVLKPFPSKAAAGSDPRGRFLEAEPVLLAFGEAALRNDREPTSRAGLVRLLRTSLRDALTNGGPDAPARLFASVERERRTLLAEVARGERTALASARTFEEVDAALGLAREFPLRLSLLGASGATELEPAIARAAARVVLPPLHPSLPREELKLAASLDAAGVRLAFSTRAPESDPAAIRFSAALAMRNGLPETSALRALTLGGAEAAGVEKSLGSLEAGKDADLAVFDGPPLALASKLLRVYADGRLVHDASGKESQKAPGAKVPAVEETL